MNGTIFDIARFSVDDGPGIRTVVYLKGCNLHCLWCHNPESQNAYSELFYYKEKCMQCGNCVKECPQKAHVIINEKVHFIREKCTNCGQCCTSCYTDALVMTGNEMSVSAVLSEIKKDALYYKNSGGGITFSGGEPILQINFLKQLLIECKKLGYHTAIETAGHVPFESFLEILPYTDLFLYDIKIMNDSLHKKTTGDSNELIIENLKNLAKEQTEIWVRTPLIHGINDSTEEMTAITEFVSTLKKIKKHEFLPYNSLGESKYKHLGLTYSLFK